MVNIKILATILPTYFGIITTLVLAFLALMVQLYYCKQKRMMDEYKAKYKGVLENYQGAQDYLMKVHTLMSTIVFIITLIISIFMYKFYEYDNGFWDIILFITWMTLMFTNDMIFNLIIKHKYYEYYE